MIQNNEHVHHQKDYSEKSTMSTSKQKAKNAYIFVFINNITVFCSITSLNC